MYPGITLFPGDPSGSQFAIIAASKMIQQFQKQNKTFHAFGGKNFFYQRTGTAADFTGKNQTAAAIFQHLANGDKYTISAEGKANADVIDNGKGLTVADGLAIQACDAGLIKNTDFPMTADEYEAAVK